MDEDKYKSMTPREKFFRFLLQLLAVAGIIWWIFLFATSDDIFKRVDDLPLWLHFLSMSALNPIITIFILSIYHE